MTDRQATSGGRPVLAWLALLLALTLPGYILAELSDVEPLPGLPLSGLMAFMPAAAALILARDRLALLARSFDWGRMRGRLAYAPAILLMPAVAVGAYAAMRLAGQPLPHQDIPLWAPPAMLAAFFLAGLGEELGWSAYLLRPLEARRGALGAALLIGVVWAAWHLIPFLQGGRDAEWIAWQCLKTVAVRVVMVWLYVNTGRSVFAVALFHAFDNMSAFLFPAWGSHYDPRLTALIVSALAVAAVIGWGARTLAGRR